MTEDELTALQAAQRLRHRLESLAHERLAVDLPTADWEKILHLTRQIEKATAHGWDRAAGALRTDLARAVDYCRDRLGGLFARLDQDPKPLPSLASLYGEILSLYQEFEEVEIADECNELSVTTEPIRLEGVFLGPFQIRLHFADLGAASPYTIKALDPHPAASNDDVTHPHVQAGRLCEGDGRTAIQNALMDGRFGDFFLLVAQVLRTYGKGSAYIELDNWDGVSCSECGDSLSEHRSYYCNHCETTLCADCAQTCAGCDESYCSYCLESCALCGESYCSLCLKACQNCRQKVCADCLTQNLCEKCHDQLQPSHSDETLDDDEEDHHESAVPCPETTTAEAPLAVGG